MKNSDRLFKDREVTHRVSRAALCVAEKDRVEACDEARALVLPLTFGCMYTVRATHPTRIRSALLSDLCTLHCEPSEQIPFDRAEDFICTPLKEGCTLVLEAEDAQALHFYERPILLFEDTEDEWFYPETGLHLEKGRSGCYGDTDWTADELLENLYEPLRKKYSSYISRECIGYDESGAYAMYAYTFAPAAYEKTLFITAGIHGDEFEGVLALARFLSLTCEQDGTHPGLAYLRSKVRLIVVPIVNVWSRAETKGRKNSKDVDLNRDFDAFTQAESRNIAALLRRYKDEIDTVMDLHCAGAKHPGLWYQFNVQAKNAAASFKCINHTAQRIKEKGFAPETDLSKIPGKYIKSNAYLQGYAYNELGLANIVIEHNLGKWYERSSAEAFAHAVECYGNFIIQTALSEK